MYQPAEDLLCYFDDELKDYYKKACKILGFDVPLYNQYYEEQTKLDDYPRNEFHTLYKSVSFDEADLLFEVFTDAFL